MFGRSTVLRTRLTIAGRLRAQANVQPLQRRALSAGEFPRLDEKDMERLMGNPLIGKLIRSPRAMEALKETTQALSEKGYAGNMGVMKQVKLMMDKGVRTKMLDLKKIMDEEGIELRQEDMQGLFEVMGWSDKKKD